MTDLSSIPLFGQSLETTIATINEEKRDKLRKKYLDPENMTHKALIYRMMCDSWTCYGQEFATIAIMRWACAYDRAITDYLRRLHELKREGVITNRLKKSKNGTEFAIWRVT